MPKPIAIVVVSLLALTAAGAEESEDTFRSEIAGIELSKPSGWQFQTLETIARHRADVKMKDEELQRVIQELATAPLVVATKHPEPYDSLNPSFQALVRPLGGNQGVTGSQVLEAVVPTLESGFADFRLVEEITKIEVDGVPGARLSAEYTVQGPDGTVYPTRATIVVVPRGSFLYQFSFSAPPTGSDALTDEVEGTLSSVVFLDVAAETPQP